MKIKYRVYHYDLDRFNAYRYGYLDLATIEEAIRHYHKARTATEIYRFEGRKRCEAINPRTRLPL